MKIKEFNDLIANIPYTEVTSGVHKGMELFSGNYVMVLNLDCDIDIKHYLSATYTNPEEYEIVVTKDVSDLKVYSDDQVEQYYLNDSQYSRLVKAIKENLNVVY